ncbi:MAG: phytanoyl-CoA dioxygenase family protein [Rubripirellula sp.]
MKAEHNDSADRLAVRSQVGLSSKAKRDRFDADGYLSLPRFIDSPSCTELRTQLQRLLNRVVPTLPSDQVFYEDKSNPDSLKQIQHLENHDDWFHQLFTASPFRALAETLLEDDVAPKNLQYFNKPPQTGMATPPHQDGYYFMLDPCEAVTMWLALDPVDEENGCVRYVRGSHLKGMRPHSRTTTLGFSQGIEYYPSPEDAAREIAAPANPGDLLVHHAMTIHRADANRSTTRQRRALGFIYYAASAKEDVASHQAYQRKLAAEMKQADKLS